MKKYICTACFLLSVITITAQNAADSLQKLIAAEISTAKKADLLLQLSDVYRSSNPESSREYATRAINLFRTLKDSAGIAKAEIHTTYFHFNNGHPDSALETAQKNISWLQSKPALLSLLAQYYSISGLCYMKLDRKKEALDRFYLALEKAELCNDDLTRLKATVNIGWAKMELNQFEQAIESFHSAITLISQKKLSQKYSPTAYNNLASCYGSLNKTDSAQYYSQKAIEIAKQNGDIAAEANGLFILGTALEKKGQYDEALKTFLKAQPLRNKIGDPFFIVSDLSEIASLYAKLGRTKEGIATAESALKTALENKITAKLPMIYTALAGNYETENDFKNALIYYKKINALKDSMYADASPKALAEMQARYESEKKERMIERQHNRIVRQNFLFIGAAGLVLLTGLLLHSQYKKNKLRQETKLQTEIMKQQQMAVKAVLEAEENERERIAKDLHDGVGQMMSAAKMNLSAFESEIQFQDAEHRKAYEKIITLVDESCKEVRTVSHIMMPNALLKNNLGTAISDFVDKLSNKHLEVHVYTEGLDERMDSNIETVLYRIIQECVNNAIKHAGATTLDISLIRDKDGISGTIEDNGKGFDATDKEKFEGIGLKNITTRIKYLKGTVDFDSAPGRGTVVALHVPTS